MKRKLTVIRVGNGLSKDGDKEFKSYPYVGKVSSRATNTLLSGRDVKLTAVGGDSVFNMVKVADMVQKEFGRVLEYAGKDESLEISLGSEKIEFGGAQKGRARTGTANWITIKVIKSHTEVDEGESAGTADVYDEDEE